jgi:hypothetical protein
MTPKLGDRVRSESHGTVGFLHHLGSRDKAWVSDGKDGESGQYFLMDDLKVIKSYEKTICHCF